MSFGSHLEELRLAIFKSLGVTLLGFLIGLSVGKHVVHFIQIPLRTALETHYRENAQNLLLKRLEEMRDNGLAVPADLEATAKEMADDNLVPLTYYVDLGELKRALGLAPEDKGTTSPTAPTKALSENPSPHGPKTEAAHRPDIPTPKNRAKVQRSDLVKIHLYQPLENDPRLRVVGLGVQEGFMVYIKASLITGVLITSPFIFYFIWEFVAAGLYSSEKKYIYIYLPMSLGLFLAGAALAFFVAFDYVLNFLFWFYQKMELDPGIRISDWVSFVMLLPLGFGVSFQLPLAMLFLERIGVFTIELYLQKWRVAVLVIAVLSMFLTPADPGSMVVMGIPLVVLYFGGIGLCRFMPRSKPIATEEAQHEAPPGA